MQAVALLVLAEPLLFELVVADEVGGRCLGPPLGDQTFPLFELLVEIGPVGGIEEFTVDG